MGPRLVPMTIVVAMAAFTVAAATAGVATFHPPAWSASVSLAILGGITPMIYAVNFRVVPVFARRAWPSAPETRVQIWLSLAGAWTVYGGRIADSQPIVVVGSALCLVGGVVFTDNIRRLFRQPPSTPAPPLPFPNQAAVDQVATRFTRLAGGFLLLGLLIGFVTNLWQPKVGRWDLVWAHTMLVGFFLSMAAGVCYHVMARWTLRDWRSITLIRLHFVVAAISLPLMLAGLAVESAPLFAVAGPLQVTALLLFIASIGPMLPGLPNPTRLALIIAFGFLLVGIGLGGAFALAPGVGARFRPIHAELNLYGWTGLLISGMGYYLAPRFAGQPLRWPKLAHVQLALIGGGVISASAGWFWLIYASGPAALVAGAQLVVASGFVLFGLIVSATFRGRSVPAGGKRPHHSPDS